MRPMLSALLLALLVSTAVALVPDSSPSPSTAPPRSSKSAGEFRGRVAVACADGRRRAAMAWSEKLGGWLQLTFETACPASENDADTYRDLCRRAYPDRQILNVEPAVEHESFSNWCPLNEAPNCPILNVRPFECLSGPFQSPSLLVSRGCQFKHSASESGTCQLYEYWRQVAETTCARLPGKTRLDRYSALQPCNNYLSAGYYAAVEFVCCPDVKVEVSPPEVEPPRRASKVAAVAAHAAASAAAAAAAHAAAEFNRRAFELESPSDLLGLGKDADEARYQRYLAVPTEPGHSEHERFLDAKRGLRHHQAVREGAMVKELQDAESRILGLTSRDPDSAQRLLAEVEKQFQRSFLSVQREEEAEHDQLDSVHQQRINLLLVGKLNHVKRLLADSIAEGNAKAARKYFSRLASLITREIVRLANRADRLSPHLSNSHLATLRRHAAALRSDLNDANADAGLRRLLGLSVVAAELARYEAVLAKADKKLAEATATSGSDGQAYPPKLAERFDNLLRLYHEQSARVLQQARSRAPTASASASSPRQHPRERRPESEDPDAVRHINDKHQPDEASRVSYKATSADAESGVAEQQTQLRYPKQSLIFVIIFCSLAFLLTLVVIFVTVRICRTVYGASAPSGKGYKLSLVDDDEPASAKRVCDNGAPYSYPTLHPEKACLGDAHLANMQMNGYENPTYKFYEEK